MGILKFKSLGHFALISGCLALLAELSIIPVVRTLANAASFWSLWFLLALSIVSASVAIFVGSATFRSRRSKTALFGFALGMLVFLLFLGYGLVLWLIYL